MTDIEGNKGHVTATVAVAAATRRRSSCSTGVAAALGAIILLLSIDNAGAATQHVANYGVDSISCGSSTTDPCRSITQAIANADAGDSISVGPGVYGDLDGDGVLGETGEEPGLDLSSLVEVNKSVKVFSTDGAGATLLLAPPNLGLEFVVSLQSAGAELGRFNKGFTLLGASSAAVSCDSFSGVKIVGNRITAGEGGIGIDTYSCDSAVVAKNVITGHTNGSDTGINQYLGEGSTLTGNVVTGFELEGLGLAGRSIVMAGNVATANKYGVSLFLFDPTFGPPAKFDRNSIIGNREGGLDMGALESPSGGQTVTLSRSNVFANGELSANCGVSALNGDTTDPLTVNATGFFWGSASGPGVNPADAIGGPCNSGAGALTVNAPSPAAKPISIKAPPQR